MSISKKKLLTLSLITLVGFSLLAMLIIVFIQKKSAFHVFKSGFEIWIQIIVGLIYGTFCGFFSWAVVGLPFLKETKFFFIQLIKPAKLGIPAILFISLCAGIGEEFLFRGTIQPYLGIWITSVIFVAIHGYLNPSRLELSFFGLVMTVLIAGMGLLAIRIGLIAAMASHTMVDIILLYKLSHAPLEEEPIEEE